MLAIEKPGLIERFGVACNSSDLSPIEGREGAVERIAALAYAQINPGAGEHEASDVIEIDPRSELAAVLIRLKVGRQHREADRASALLVQFILHQKAYARWKLRGGDGLLQRFVRQALAEWLYDTCPECSGAAWRGMERDSTVTKRIKCRPCGGRGRFESKTGGHPCPTCAGMGKRFLSLLRPLKPKECSACSGTGMRVANDGERARTLRVDLRVYQKFWLRRFLWIESRLDVLLKQEKTLLRAAR